MVIYVDTPLDQPYKDKLRQKAAGADLIFRDELPGEAEQQDAVGRAEVIFGNPKAALLKEARSLRWMQLYSAGFAPYRTLETAAQVTNMQDYFSVPCAETMIAGILALYRRIDHFTLLKEEQRWNKEEVRGGLDTLFRKKVIILGRGSIGRHVARILEGFSCQVRFYGRAQSDADLTSPQQLEEALPDTDVVIACLPGVEETRGLFTASMVTRMHSRAVFCNVGRGNLVADEGALVEALHAGRLGGAVLDVTAEEPLPPGHPLWSCPNTILTQHSGGGTFSEYEGILSFFLENLERYKKGEPLKNIIQLDKGY